MKKRVVRILSILMVLVMMIGLLPAAAFAADNAMSMEVVSAEGMPGTMVQVELKVTENPGIASMKIKVNYGDELTLKSITYNTEWGGMAQKPHSMGSPVTLTWINGTQNYTAAESVFATLNFEISKAAQPGKVELTVTFDQEDIYNLSEKNIPMNIVNGSVYVKPAHVPGDINGDGNVNNKDLTRLFQYIANWDVTVNEAVLDTNGDGKVNNKDLTRLFQYLANWDVELFPKPADADCIHSLEAIKEKAGTCVEPGNIAYWHCTLCGKCFADANGQTEISQKDTVVPASHSLITVPAKNPTYENDGNIEYWQCEVCEKYFRDAAGEVEIAKADTVIPKLNNEEYLITYDIYGGDSYLKGQPIVNENPSSYNGDKTVKLINLTAPAGYVFEGWYDAPKTASRFERVYDIPAGSTGIVQLYAHWSEIVYNVTYKLYQTPVDPIKDEEFLHYTVSKGLPDLPNPELYNYVFLGWYTEDGNAVDSIPVGTTEDLTLNAFWTSNRNLAKQNTKLEDPIILEDRDNSVIYFTYEIGTIHNIPLTENIWSFQGVEGLEQQISVTVTKSTTSETAENIATVVSKSTVDSGSWSLSDEWSEETSVNEEWAKQQGMSLEEAEEKARTSTDTYSLTASEGRTETNSTTDGTTVKTYNTKDETDGNSQELDVHLGGSYTQSLESSLKGELGVDIDGTGSAGVSGSLTSKDSYTLDASVDGKLKWDKQTTNHTGTDTTTVNTNVNTSTASFNSSQTMTNQNAAMESESVRQTLSEIISKTTGYGESYILSENREETQGYSNTDTTSTNTSSTVTYSLTDIETTTKTYSSSGKKDGWYRLVIAGTMHVFAVIGYDVATQSYFSYTFNVADDKTYEFLDYSPDGSFNDCEYSALSFEVPHFVYEYTTALTATTEGLEYGVDSSNNTATVTGYVGQDADVIVPTYVSDNNTAYRVTGIEADAFAGTSVRSVILSSYIDEIPEGAFRDCTELEQISGSFTKINSYAFSGCTSLTNFNVSDYVTYLGEKAFDNVPSIYVKVVSEQNAKAVVQSTDSVQSDETDIAAEKLTQDLINAALNSGAKTVKLNLTNAMDCAWKFDVPEMDTFLLHGGGRTFKNLEIKSNAKETQISSISIENNTVIPFRIASEKIIFNDIVAQSSSYVLLASKKAHIELLKDNRLISDSQNAVVWKEPTLVNTKVGVVNGKLRVTGNVYSCGPVTGKENMTITGGVLDETISEEMFNQYINGSSTVSLDANGGSLDVESVVAFYGQPYGALPVPQWDYYKFVGWFTEQEGGKQITEEAVCDTTDPQKLYAHWEQEISDWVKESEVPEDAMIVETQYTYIERVEIKSDEADVDGYTLFHSGTEWSEYGPWSDWSEEAVEGSESRDVEVKQQYRYRDVTYTQEYSAWSDWGEWSFDRQGTGEFVKEESRTVWGYYYYLCPYCGAHMHGWGQCWTWAGGCGAVTKNDGGAWHEIWSDIPWEQAGLQNWHGTGKYYTYLNGELVFRWNGNGDPRPQYRYATRSLENVPHYGEWSDWSDSEYEASDGCEVETGSVYRYRDRTLVDVYYLYKLENRTSENEVQPTDSITNVEKWVRYIEK